MNMTQKITRNLHPDALYDAIYEDHEIDLASYLPFTGEFSLTTDAEGITLTSAQGCIRVDAWSDGVIRLRVAPGLAKPASLPTEHFGLLESRPATIPVFTCRQEAATFILATSPVSVDASVLPGGKMLVQWAVFVAK